MVDSGYGYNRYGRRSFSVKRGPEYKNYRVKSPIKSFRDLEVYRRTNELAVEIFQIKTPRSVKLKKEFEILQGIAKQVPRLIGESYGDKFASLDLALAKLERAARLISNIITRLDFLGTAVPAQAEGLKEALGKALRKYQIQRVKILNLKRAWERVFRKKT